LLARIRLESAAESKSYEPESVRLGNQAASATPIWALVLAIVRSAAATAGLRNSSCEGTPAGTTGTWAARCP
jgi:hypothetical protein